MSAVTASCPVRIDLAGGTTDIWPLPLVLGGPIVTVNVALDLPAVASVARHEDPADPHVHLFSEDQNRRVQYEHLSALRKGLDDGTCPLPLLGLAVAHAGGDQGVRVTTRAQSPEGAGLGGSSALLVALVGALDRLNGVTRNAETHVSLAQDIETKLVRTPTGFQDYYPSLHGGCLALQRHVGGMRVEKLPVDLDALAARLRIAYTGVPHHSGITNWGVVRGVFDETAGIADALREIGARGRDVEAALRDEDLDGALDAVLAEGTQRATLGKDVITPQIQRLDREVRAAGARGTKVLGAGGGGCVLVVLPRDPEGAVDEVLSQGPWRPIPVSLSATGLSFGGR